MWEQQWNTVPPRSVLESQLDDSFERVETEEQTLWKRKSWFLFSDWLELTDEDDVIVTRRWSGTIRVALLFLLLVSPVLIFSPLIAICYGGIVLVLYGPRDTKPPIAGCNRIVADYNSGYVGLLSVVWILSTALWVSSVFRTRAITIGISVVVVIALILLYIEDYFPFIDSDLNRRVLLIPWVVLSYSASSLLIFFPTLMLAVFLFSTGSFFAETVAGEDTDVATSAFADIIGESMRTASGSIDTEAIRQAFLDMFLPFLIISLTVSAIIGLVWIHQCATLRSHLKRYRLDVFSSTVHRTLVMSLFFLLNGLLLCAATVAIGILLFGVTGTYYLPEATLQPFLTPLPDEVTPQPTEFLKFLYGTMDHTTRTNGGVPARISSVVVLSLLLWPFVFVACGTVVSILRRPYRVLRVLYYSTPVAEGQGQGLIQDGIQVRRIDQEGYPDMRPLELGFGIRKYVIVSDVIVDEFPDDELAALLQHEKYHFQERDYSLVADIASVLVGGRNIVLAFRDYRDSERAADDYAAGEISADALRNGIRRIYDLRTRYRRNPVKLGHPSIAGLDAESKQPKSDRDPLKTRFLNFIRRTRVYITSPYQLCFGSILLDSAHLNQRERIARLRNDTEEF